MWKVNFYKTPSGRNPVLDYLGTLEKFEEAQVLRSIAKIRQFGLKAACQFRQIEGKLWEIKISSSRIFYVTLEEQEMLLLHAYKKQGQKLPHKEREVALKRMKEVLL